MVGALRAFLTLPGSTRDETTEEYLDSTDREHHYRGASMTFFATLFAGECLFRAQNLRATSGLNMIEPIARYTGQVTLAGPSAVVVTA